ncbi:hypothetical protein [Chthonobacter albigriseus]|uniref:hypothetical protein n=1 Tax=Chthonobacter albigriseus TaxID=1683161 RepID=UPI0015EF4085|nr:hypothetical protein [Chthonobacter albigriseus]
MPDKAFDQEITALLAAAGLQVPPDLAAGVYSEARDLRRITSLLRGPRTAAAEPSNIFSLARYAPAGDAK